MASLHHSCKYILNPFKHVTFFIKFSHFKSKISFRRGQGEAIPGLDEAVGTMRRNEQSQFIFSPDWAFGDLGCPPRIPPKAYVYFKIDLIDWIDSSATEYED